MLLCWIVDTAGSAMYVPLVSLRKASHVICAGRISLKYYSWI